MPWFWRKIYGLLAAPWLEKRLAAGYRKRQQKSGSGPARKYLRRTLFALALVRWRNYQGYVPLQAWAAYWKIARSVDSQGQLPPKNLCHPEPVEGSDPLPASTTSEASSRHSKGNASPRPDTRPLRIGLLGMIAYLPFFPRKLFCNLPPGIEIHLFETVREIPPGHYLRQTNAASLHTQILKWNNDAPSTGIHSQPDYHARVEEVARQINHANLDLLLVSEPGREIYDVLDRIDTPAIGDLTSTSNACFHPRIGLQFYIHSIKDYVVHNHRLYCQASQQFLPHPDYVIPYCLLFDSTGYEGPPVPWAERQHALFFHGRLVKASQPQFLKIVMQLLADDSSLTWILYGMDSHHALDHIRAAARKHGVETRVDFRGKFSLARNPQGEITDPGWHNFLRDLRHAKLAPTSFPMASGCARFESYTASVPCVNLAIRTDNRRWTAPDQTLVDIPALYTPSATVTTLRDYKRIAQQLLHDPALAEKVIAEQHEIVNRLGSPNFFWQQITEAYAQKYSSPCSGGL